MPRVLVAVNAQGRVTLPADVRKRLHLGDGDQLEVSVEDDRISLRPAHVVADEDAWAYTADSLAAIRRSLTDIRDGRVYQLGEADLLAGRYPRRPRSPRRRRSRAER